MDSVNYNGALVRCENPELVPGRLLSQNYVYQHIHTFDHRGLYLDTHLEILGRAMRRIYGIRFDLPEERLQREIGALLESNRYPHGSNRVTLRIFPPDQQAGTEASCYLLEATGQLFYPHYVLWHKRPLLEVFPCDCPWPGLPTSVSLLSAAFGRDAATRGGAELAVLENRDGTLTGIDDEPLFLVSERELFTTPLSAGATDSVLRRLTLAVCRAEKIPVYEYPLTREMLTRCDEAFTLSVQGIVALLGYGDYRYFNLMSVRLSERLNGIVL